MLGRKLKAIRIFRGLTQEQLAEKLGMTSQQVSGVERAESMNTSTLAAFAKALGVTEADIYAFGKSLPE